MTFASVTQDTLIQVSSAHLKRHLAKNFGVSLISFKIIERDDENQFIKILAFTYDSDTQFPRLFKSKIRFNQSEINPSDLIPFQNSLMFLTDNNSEHELNNLVDNFKLQGLNEKEIANAVISFYEDTLSYLEREKKNSGNV